MKQFFSLNLRGRDVVWPMLGLWLLMMLYLLGVVVRLLAAPESGMTVVDWGFALRLLVGFAWYTALGVGVMMTLLPAMKHSIGALSYGDVAFECDYSTRQYVGLVVGGVALTVLTCGLYLPWFITRLMKFFCEGVSHSFHLMTFRGKAMRLFAITILTYVLPMVAVAVIMQQTDLLDPANFSFDMMSFTPLMGLGVVLVELFCVSLFVVLLCRWWVDVTYGDKIITTRMSALPATGYIVWQLVLSLLTVGLYAPMASLRTMQYVAERSVVVGADGEEKRMGLRLRSWRDWAWMWGQVLLLVVTLGIYLPWYYAKTMNRFGGRLYVEEPRSIWKGR